MSYNPGNFGGGSSLGIDLSNLPTFDDIVIDISPEQIEAALARYNATSAMTCHRCMPGLLQINELAHQQARICRA